jgi:hypothetical protein
VKDRIQIKADEIELDRSLTLAALPTPGVPVAAAVDLLHGEARGDIQGNSGAQADDLSDEEIAAPGRDGFDDKFPFEAMKLKVGDRMQLQLPELLSRDRVIVRLIGYVNNQSLLVTPPRDAQGFRFNLLENDSLVVRVFTSQNAFGFSATVSKIIKVPFEYLHLTFPSEVKGVVIRKAPRVRTRIICSVVAGQSGGDGLPGLLVNLSANGALLDSRQEIAAKGAMIKLSFRIKLHAVDALLTINAIVRAQFIDDTSGAENSASGLHVVHHGLEFVDLSPNDSLILQSMIYQQMIEQPKTVL